MIRKLLAVLALSLSVAIQAFAQAEFTFPAGENGCSSWVAQHFARGKVPPFSFEYGGVPSSKLLPRWKFSVRKLEPERSGEALTSYSWTDPRTGLRVECVAKTFDDFNAMEWVLRFRNTSSSDTPAISSVRTVDLRQACGEGDCSVFHAEGPYFGRADFKSRDTLLVVRDTMLLSPAGGRSSSHTLPYFNIKTPCGGMVYGVGWTGTWTAEIARPDKRDVSVRAGLKFFDSYLKPGEEIRTASAFMIPWQGEDRMDGQNMMRRFILAHHHPEAGGRPVEPPLLNNFDHTGPWPCDEYACMTDFVAKAVVRQYEFLGTLSDGFWLDAGWYSRSADWEKGYWWHSAVGNWTPDPKRFPDGLAPVADEVHRTGGKFLLWYEPERANVDSDWAHAHPEWMLAESGEKAVPLDEPRDTAFLVNLGNPEALEFVCREVVKSLTDNKVDIYRQDFNIDGDIFWANNDEPGRTGMCEVKYIEGLYEYLDYLHGQLPHLIIDNCAGGGRRLDFEMVSRSIAMWKSDYTLNCEGKQCHTYYLSQWLPVHGTNTSGKTPYIHRSSLGTSMCFCWGITDRTKLSIQDERHIIERYREMKSYFLEDFYPLSGYGDLTGDDIWLSYQLNKPSDGTGYVIAFRRSKCEEADCTVCLRGLDAGSEYALELLDPDGTERVSVAGKDVVRLSGSDLSAGLTLHLDNPLKSLVIRYSKL